MATWVNLELFQNFVGNTKSSDEMTLRAALDLGCVTVDELCGPTVPTTVVEHVRAGGYRLPLRARAESLVSVATWPGGATLPVEGFAVEGQTICRRGTAGWIGGDLTVTYIAGAAEAPPWAVSAALLIGKQWLNSRLRPNLNDPTTLVGFLVPKQAQEIMAAHLLAPEGLA